MFPHDESDALPPTAALTFRVKPEAAENIVGWHLPSIHVATDKKQEGMGVGVALCMSELAVRQARAGTISMRAPRNHRSGSSVKNNKAMLRGTSWPFVRRVICIAR